MPSCGGISLPNTYKTAQGKMNVNGNFMEFLPIFTHNTANFQNAELCIKFISSAYLYVSATSFYFYKQDIISIQFYSNGCLPIYLDFCLLKSIAHTITATLNTSIKYHRFSRQKPLSNINRYPQEAGKISPIVSKKSGRNSIGNIIPESIIEGKNTSCAIIVSFA